jgi:PHD/YefM family antitoxin component YafN of YafNO toxin-antitoxin module
MSGGNGVSDGIRRLVMIVKYAWMGDILSTCNLITIFQKGRTIAMEKIFYEIYEKVISYEQDIIEMNRNADNAIMDNLQQYESQIGRENMNQLQDQLFHAVQTAERESFFLGMRYAAKMLWMMFMK